MEGSCLFFILISEFLLISKARKEIRGIKEGKQDEAKLFKEL